MKTRLFYVIALLLLGSIDMSAQSFQQLLNSADSLKMLYGEEDNRYLDALTDAIQVPFQEGDYTTALKYRKVHNDIVKRKYGEKSSEYAEGLFRQGNIYLELYGPGAALGYYTRAYEIFKEREDTSNPWFMSSLRFIGSIRLEIGDFDGFLQKREEELSFYEVNHSLIDEAWINASIGEAYFEREQFEESLPFLTAAIQLYELAPFSETVYDALSTSIWTAKEVFRKKGDKKVTLEWDKKYLSFLNEHDAPETHYWDIYYSLGIDNEAFGNNEDAVKYYELFRQTSNLLFAQHPTYLNEKEIVFKYFMGLHRLACLYESSSIVDKAIECREEIDEVVAKKNGFVDMEDKALNDYLLFRDYRAASMLKDALSIGRSLQNDLKNRFEFDYPDYYADYLGFMTVASRVLGEAEASIDYACKLADHGKRNNNDNWIIQAYFNKASASNLLGNIVEARNYIILAIDAVKKLPPSFENTSMLYECMLAEGELYENESVQLALEKYKQIDSLATSLGNNYIRNEAQFSLGRLYMSLLDYFRAKDYFISCQHYFESNQLMADPLYAGCLNNLALCYSNLGKFADFRRIIEKAKKIASDSFGVNSDAFLTALSNAIDAYCILEDYENAYVEAKQYYDLSRVTYGDDNEKVAFYAEYILATVLNYKGDYAAAAEHAAKALFWVKNHYSEVSFDKVWKCYHVMGEIIEKNNEAEVAFTYYHEGFLQAIKKILPNIEQYANSITGDDLNDKKVIELYCKEQGRLYSQIQRELASILPSGFDDLVRFGQYNELVKMKPLFEGMFQDTDHNNDAIVGSLAQLMALAEVLSNIKDDQWLSRIVSLLNRQYVEELLLLSELDREKYYLRLIAKRNLVFSLRASDRVNGEVYDCVLRTKNVLLGANAEIRKMIVETGDSILVAAFDSLQRKKQFLDEQTAQTSMDAMSLKRTRMSIQAEEREISRMLCDKGVAPTLYTWEDIKQSLGDNEVAIEYSVFTNPSTSDERCVALVLRKEFNAPVYVDLGATDHISQLGFSSDLYEGLLSEELYNRIWAPVDKYINEGDTVFYSLDGVLNYINLSAILKNKYYLGDLYNMVYCSSTSQIVDWKFISTDSAISDVAIWGGLEYDRNELNEQPIISSQTRSGWNYLPGSLQECLNITSLLDESHIAYRFYSGQEGDEASFKKLAGTDVDVLHLSTHGFYIPQEQSHKPAYLNDNIEDDLINSALLRSGIIMSGGNSAWMNNRERSLSDDGILTALEIGNLSFSNVSLVVLSSCESGLGDISKDGVLGLQRSFKNAGVQSIIMSLWEVDDEATQYMMTEFYSSLIKDGAGKRKAFQKAVSAVRKEYPDPYYWAAFVMLD